MLVISLTVLGSGRRRVVDALQRVHAPVVQDVVKAQDEHHDHALFVLHGNDVGVAQEIRTWRTEKAKCSHEPFTYD